MMAWQGLILRNIWPSGRDGVFKSLAFIVPGSSWLKERVLYSICVLLNPVVPNHLKLKVWFDPQIQLQGNTSL